jgi:hypothetical protein
MGQGWNTARGEMEESSGLFVTKPVYGLSPQDDEI